MRRFIAIILSVPAFLSAEPLDLRELGAPTTVQRHDGVEIDGEMLFGNRGTNEVGRFTEEFGIEHDETVKSASKDHRAT